MNIIITGATGFVGKNLSKFLKEKGHHISPLSLRKAWELDQNAEAIIHLAGKAHDTKNTSAEKEYFDIKPANQNGSYKISADSIAPELLTRKFKKLSNVEKVFYLSVIVTAIVLAIGMVFVRTKIIEVEQNTLTIQAEVTTKEDQLKAYDQQINELMTDDRVAKQASDSGLKMNNDNVIKATK